MKVHLNVKAFTLIEMLVVIVVIAILATLAFMRFDLYLAHQKLDTESYKINTFINTARVRALKTENIHQIRFVPNAATPQVIEVVDLLNNTVVESFDIGEHEIEGRRGILVTSTVPHIDINPRDFGFNIQNPIVITIFSDRFEADVKHYRIRFVPNETKIHFEMVTPDRVTSL